jgi:hypothetical protein
MGEIRVGKPDTTPDAPAHTPGVREGNKPPRFRHTPGHHKDGTADARRSTGISPKKHDVILPVMPNLPPG